MYMTYSQLLEMPEMKHANVVAGKDGLDRIITWNHVIELPNNIGEWLNSGEIIFNSGVALKNINEDLLNIVEDLDKNNASGLILEVGPYIKQVPNKVKVLSDKLNFPIIELPFEEKVIDISYKICQKIFDNSSENRSMSKLLKELLYLEYTEDFEEKAIFYGFNHKERYIGAVIQIDNFFNFIEKNNINNKNGIENLQRNILRVVIGLFEKKRKKILYMEENNSIILMIPINSENEIKKHLSEMFEEIQDRLSLEIKGITASVGIGNTFKNLEEFKRSIVEAKKSIKILRACNRTNTIRIYDEIGIYRLFFNLKQSEELDSILKGALGSLLEYDEKNESDLVNTLEVYLMNNCNIGKTAEVLFIHRNTFKYRIKRIQEILLCDLQDVNTCFNLRLAYKIKRFLENVNS